MVNLTKNPGNVYCTIDDEVQYHGNSPPVKLHTRKEVFKSPRISSTASDLIKTNSAMTYMPHDKFNGSLPKKMYKTAHHIYPIGITLQVLFHTTQLCPRVLITWPKMWPKKIPQRGYATNEMYGQSYNGEKVTMFTSWDSPDLKSNDHLNQSHCVNGKLSSGKYLAPEQQHNTANVPEYAEHEDSMLLKNPYQKFNLHQTGTNMQKQFNQPMGDHSCPGKGNSKVLDLIINSSNNPQHKLLWPF